MRWWQVSAAVLMLVSSQATIGRADDSAPLSLARRLDVAIAAFHGTAGVVVADPRRVDRYAHEAERVFPSASLYKLGLMVEAYRRVADGSLSLGNTFTVLDEDDEESYTAAGEMLTLGDAIERMITLSDNTSAHMLERLLDAHRVNATVASLGLTDTRINIALPREERTAPFNTTSARDMERLFGRLVNGTVVGPVYSGAMLATLGRQRVNDRLPTGVPPGTFLAHKTGNLDGIAHDVGVIGTPAGPRVVVVLTSHYARYDEVTALTRRVAELAFDSGLAGIVVRDQRKEPPSATPADLTVAVVGAAATEASAEPGGDPADSAPSTPASGLPTPIEWRGVPPSSTMPAPEPPPSVLLPPVGQWTHTLKSPDAQAGAKAPWLRVAPLEPLLSAPTLPSTPWALPLKQPQFGSTPPIVPGPSPSFTMPKAQPSSPAVPAAAPAPIVGAAPRATAPSVGPLVASSPVAPHVATAPADLALLTKIAPPAPPRSAPLAKISPPAPPHQVSLARKATDHVPTHPQADREMSHGKATRLSSVAR